MPKWTDGSGKLHQKAELIWVFKGEQGAASRKEANENILGRGKRATIRMHAAEFYLLLLRRSRSRASLSVFQSSLYHHETEQFA